ncbi:MAG: hypothetical protein WCH62_02185, partial [Candidatus Omnitrophota bacterium]
LFIYSFHKNTLQGNQFKYRRVNQEVLNRRDVRGMLRPQTLNAITSYYRALTGEEPSQTQVQQYKQWYNRGMSADQIREKITQRYQAKTVTYTKVPENTHYEPYREAVIGRVIEKKRIIVPNLDNNQNVLLQRQSLPMEQVQSQQAPTVFGPHTFNVDFGSWKGTSSAKSGAAADGWQGDYWNTVAVAWNNDHTQYNLKSTKADVSPIQVRLVNLGGGWSNAGRMGLKDPMLDSFNYPKNNQGGNSQVILYKVPAGLYHLYIYGHGTDSAYYGDYTLTIGGRSYGRKSTSNNMDAVENTRWVEGSQYVRFANIEVQEGESINILIKPGGVVSDGRRSFADAMICGLQLVPVNDSLPVGQ